MNNRWVSFLKHFLLASLVVKGALMGFGVAMRAAIPVDENTRELDNRLED
jgi:hypothetical protein